MTLNINLTPSLESLEDDETVGLDNPTARLFAAEAAAAGDTWLAETLVRELGCRSGIWAAAVAAGMFGRLLEEPMTRKKEVLDKLLRGESDEREMLMHTWARQLTREQVDELVAQCVAEYSMQREALLELLVTPPNPTDIDWQVDVTVLFGGRDALESVFYVLDAVGAADRVLPLIDDFDRGGHKLRRRLPKGLRVANAEMYQRPGDRHHYGWWCLGA